MSYETVVLIAVLAVFLLIFAIAVLAICASVFTKREHTHRVFVYADEDDDEEPLMVGGRYGALRAKRA